jgi:hypothetical protein
MYEILKKWALLGVLESPLTEITYKITVSRQVSGFAKKVSVLGKKWVAEAC